MQDAMGTARMSQAKKEAGSRVLEKLGYSASQFINDMFDYLIAHGASPVAGTNARLGEVDPAALAEAWAQVNSVVLPGGSRLKGTSADEIKRDRLVSRGLVEA